MAYIEKRVSGLSKMKKLTEKRPNFLAGKEPQYQTEAISFYTTFYNLNWGENGRIPIEEVANRVNSSLEKYSIDEESSVKTFGDLQKSSVKIFGVNDKDSERLWINLCPSQYQPKPWLKNCHKFYS